MMYEVHCRDHPDNFDPSICYRAYTGLAANDSFKLTLSLRVLEFVFTVVLSIINAAICSCSSMHCHLVNEYAYAIYTAVLSRTPSC